jgi:DNA-binding IclR family transcriptional regulator
LASESERHVESVQAALRLISCFDVDEGLRLHDLHEKTQLNRSRILRLAGTLAAEGYLTYDERTSCYHLGPDLFRVGQLLTPRFGTVSDAVRHHLITIVAQSGCTALFSILNGQSRLVLSKEEPDEALRYTVREGQLRPLPDGASGRVMLAFGDKDLWDALRRSKLHTNIDFENLAEKIAAVKAQGFEISVSELSRHAFAIAVPVLRKNNDLFGVLTIAGAEANYSSELSPKYIEILRHQADLIPSETLANLKP